MSQTRWMIFDDGKGVFGPLTDLRAAFELRTGRATTLGRMGRIMGQSPDVLIVPPHLAAIAGARYPQASVNVPPPQRGAWWLVNGRCANAQVLERVSQLALGQALLQEDRTLVGAHVELTDDWELPRQIQITTLSGRVLLDRPWHIHEELADNLENDLAACTWPSILKQPGVTVMGRHPIRVHPDARVMPGSVLCSEQGAIAIGPHCRVDPAAVLFGPCAIGANCHIAAGAHIRPQTVIGPTCKVGGEVSASIMFGFSNKAHQGYLGNSLVGYWVNLGADTTVSNLKNTYGMVRMQLDQERPRENTGCRYLGPIIGDYVRTAIGTRLPTGCVIGTACMIAVSGFAPSFADRFGFYTDAGRQPYDVEKLLQTARTMMGRRDQQLRDCEAERLLALTAGIRRRVGHWTTPPGPSLSS